MRSGDQGESKSGATDETIDSFVREAASAPPREPERILATIGRFRVLDRLRAGGMGVVYKALDDTLGRALALKVLPRDVVNDAERVRRFELEARAASALSHPNIVTIYEMGRVPPDVYYLAMELIDGDSLRAAMAARRSFAALSDVLVQVATGLAKAHAAGIVHRDLKPENIMVTRDGFAKILDFGLAKLLRPPTLLHHKGDGAPFSETESGVVLGTVGYMSPEQVRGEAVDHRTDVFAFGCILFEAATGQQPFRGSTSIDTLHAILHAPTPALNDRGSIHPPELDRIVARCLEKDPNARYDSMRDVAHDLRALATTTSGSPNLVSERTDAVSATVRPSPRFALALRRDDARARRGDRLARLRAHFEKASTLCATQSPTAPPNGIDHATRRRGRRREVRDLAGRQIRRVRDARKIEVQPLAASDTGIRRGARHRRARNAPQHFLRAGRRFALFHLGESSRGPERNVVPGPHARRCNHPSTGRNPKQLTEGRGETSAEATADGRWVLFLAPGVEKGTQTLWKIASGGGDPVQLASEHAYGAEVSPDSRKVLFKYLDPNTRKSELAILPIEGGAKRSASRHPRARG